MSTYVTGDKALIAKLQSIGKKAKPAIRKGSRKGNKLILAQAKANVPVVTGELRKSLKVRALKRSRKWTGTTVRMDARYASFVEYGTNKTRKMAARNFLRRATDQNKKSAVDTMIQNIRGEIFA